MSPFAPSVSWINDNGVRWKSALVAAIGCNCRELTGDHLEDDMSYYTAWSTTTWFLLGRPFGEFDLSHFPRYRNAERGALRLLSRVNKSK